MPCRLETIRSLCGYRPAVSHNADVIITQARHAAREAGLNDDSVDMNVAYTRGGKFVEIQGSAENAGGGFDRKATQDMLDLAVSGCEQLMVIQREALGTK